MISVCGKADEVIKTIRNLNMSQLPSSEVRYHLDRWLSLFAEALQRVNELGRVTTIKQVPCGYIVLFLQRLGDRPSRYDMGTGLYYLRDNVPHTMAGLISKLQGKEYREMISIIVDWWDNQPWRDKVEIRKDHKSRSRVVVIDSCNECPLVKCKDRQALSIIPSECKLPIASNNNQIDKRNGGIS